MWRHVQAAEKKTTYGDIPAGCYHGAIDDSLHPADEIGRTVGRGFLASRLRVTPKRGTGGDLWL